MVESFADRIPDPPLRRRSLTTLQINIGKLCNLACRHCHVGSGPNKTRENMAAATVDRCLELLATSSHIQILDITGGAPEMNPHFRRLVRRARALDKQVLVRCNLTVLFEPGQEDTAEFFKDHQVEVVASLPCYTPDNVEQQRGDGVFAQSIEALQILNRLGYGRPNSGLILNLVYNPVGANLPPPQPALKADYQKRLKEDFDIEFNELFTITNMPIKRFLVDLKRANQDKKYLQLLADHFNPEALPQVMCRDLISVSWDGKIFDCDFNQALDLPVPAKANRTVFDIDSFDTLLAEPIAVADHCYGCTAGSGSSCTGALA